MGEIMNYPAVIAPHSTGYDLQPDYKIEFEPSTKAVKVVFNGVVVAHSNRAMILRETRMAPVYYLPRADVRMDLLTASDHHTYCPFKGTASYWHLNVDGKQAENAVWSYRDPLEEAAAIKDYLAFYWNKMDAWYEEDRELSIDAETATQSHGNPYVDWLLREAWEAADSSELVARLARCLLEGGFPLWRLNVLLGTLNPLVAGTAYIWERGQDQVEERKLLHARASSPAFLESPLVPIYQGKGGVRRRLEAPDAVLDYPILAELKAKGATDYVAMPLHFSDGHINVLTLATDRAGGFTTGHLGKLYEILPLLSRLFEVQALRRNTKSLMDTYLGPLTAEMVLNGRVKRGDGETIPAVIWHADLRGSTQLAARLGRTDYLDYLNRFFDCAAGAVMAEGGEVLKFIGDAVLAILPVEDCEGQVGEACAAALRAARRVVEDLPAATADAFGDETTPLRAAIAIHLGEVTYGNVGAARRLDFTVIGPAANEVARLSDFCKRLEQPILISDRVARHLSDPLRSLGTHCLLGVEDAHEIFSISAETSSLGR